MPFTTRVFCTGDLVPSVQELVARLGHEGHPVTVVGTADPAGLMDPFWQRAVLAYDAAQQPFTLLCLRASGHGAARLREEVADFLADLAELPPTAARTRVERHLRATSTLVLVEFPPETPTTEGYTTLSRLMDAISEPAAGLVQYDGVGFYDEDDEVLLALA